MQDFLNADEQSIFIWASTYRMWQSLLQIPGGRELSHPTFRYFGPSGWYPSLLPKFSYQIKVQLATCSWLIRLGGFVSILYINHLELAFS